MRVESVRKKLKQTGFLIIMLFLVSTITYVSMSVRSKYFKSPQINPSSEVIDDTNVEPVLIAQQVEYEPEPYEEPSTTLKSEEFGYIETDFYIPNNGEAVLGSGEGCSPFNKENCISQVIEYQPVCAEAPVSYSTAGDGASASDTPQGISVSKNAIIEIWKTTSPLPILSGDENLDTTAYAITTENSNHYSGVKQVRESLVAAKYTAPGDDRQGLRDAAAASNQDIKFAVHTYLNFGGGEAEEDTIIKELESVCPEVQPSNPNPDVSQKVAQYVMNNSAIPGEPIEPRDAGFVPCIDVSTVDHLAEADVFEMCANQRGVFSKTIDYVIQAAKWAECIANPAACAQTEIVGLLIDAPYGANHKCNEGFCTDQFLDHAQAQTLVPGDEFAEATDGVGAPDDPTIDQHYVTTPCKVRVVDNVHNGIYDIPCIWDISPYKAQYDLEKHARFPDDPEYPTWEEHWGNIMEEAKRRGQICSI